jgi:hypothetical protein
MALTKEQQKIRAEWVKRLHSGEYKQGKGYLCQIINGVKEYCCLGILAEMAVEKNISPKPDKSLYATLTFNGCRSLLPHEIAKWAGLYKIGGESRNSNSDSLTGLNDTKTSFEDIANLLESPEGNDYFV